MRDEGQIERWRDEIERRATSLPDVQVESTGSGLNFKVRKKAFAYFMVDHHGDNRVAVWFKAAPGVQGELIETEGERFYVPPYMGHHGWAALDLEASPVDHDEIEQILTDAYRLSASKTQLKRLDESS